MNALKLLFGLLMLALLASSPVTSDNKPQRVALVIGNGAYASLDGLPNPANDAAAISAKLSSLDFQVMRVLDAGREQMRNAFSQFGRASAGAEIALVFYAGHGLQVNGQNYLLPVDARIRAAQDLEASSVRASEIYQQFAAAAADLSVLILDACRDNPFVERMQTTTGLASGDFDTSKLPDFDTSAGVLIAFAAAPGAVAADGDDGNSPFTTALLQWVDRPGLEISTMFRRVRQTVLTLTDGAQVPWVEEALLRDIYLNTAEPGAEPKSLDDQLWATIRSLQDPLEQQAAAGVYDRLLPGGAHGDEAQIQTAALASRSTDAGDDLAYQSVMWLSIRDSEDLQIFKAFLTRFPGSVFEGHVRNRIAELELAVTEPQPFLELQEFAAVLPSDQGADVLVGGGGAGDRPQGQGGTGLDTAQAQGDTTPDIPTDTATAPSDIEARLALDTTERMAVQRLLQAEGVYSGGIDADFGPGTRGAISALQGRSGLPETGYLSQESLAALVGRTAQQLLRETPDRAARQGIHAVAALARGGPGTEPRTLTVAGLQRNETFTNTWRAAADRFEVDNPGYIVAFDYMPGRELKETLLTRLGSATPPDLFYTQGGRTLDALAAAGFARDLTDEMSDGWALQFKPGALNNFNYQGRIHGVPLHVSVVNFWYNRTLLDQAGISPAALTTWPGFLDAVSRLRAAGITPVAAGGQDSWALQFYVGALAEEAGGPAALERRYLGQPGFSDPSFLRALGLLDQMSDSGGFGADMASLTNGQAADEVAQGRAAMLLSGNWVLNRMEKTWRGGPDRYATELGRAAIPDLSGGALDPATYGGVDGLAVRAGAPDIAVALARRLTEATVQNALAASNNDIPAIAGADSALANPLLRQAAQELSLSTHHQLYYDQAMGPDAGRVMNDVSLRLALGQIDPAAAAATVQAAWDRSPVNLRSAETGLIRLGD